MNRQLQEKIFRALFDFEALGDVMEEKTVIVFGGMMSSSNTVLEKKVLNTLDLEKEFEIYSLDEINKNALSLHEKEFIKVARISTTGNKQYLELIKTLVSLDEFLEDF